MTEDLNPKFQSELDAILSAKEKDSPKSQPPVEMGVKMSAIVDVSPGIWQIAPIILLRGTLEDAAAFVMELDEMARGAGGDTTATSVAFANFLDKAGMAIPVPENLPRPSLDTQIGFLFSEIADMRVEFEARLNSLEQSKGYFEDLKPLAKRSWWSKFISWLLPD